jgi:hypothetical protein
MEQKFATVLKKLNILVSQITDTFEHRGTRAVFFATEVELLPVLTQLLACQNRKTHMELAFGCLNKVNNKADTQCGAQFAQMAYAS